MDSRRNVWILSIGIFLMSTCYTMVIPFLPVYLLEMGTEKESVAMWSGAIFSVTFLIAGFMAPLWGKLADQKGKKRMIIRAGIGLAITYAMMGFVSSPAELFVVRALQGVANGFAPAALTLVSTSVSVEKVGSALALYTTGGVVGSVVGPLLGGLIGAAVGMRPAFYLVGIILLLVTLAVHFWVWEPKPKEEDIQQITSVWEDLRDARQNKTLLDLLSVYFISQASLMMLQPILALYVGDMLGSMSEAAVVSGAILSAGGIAGAVTANFWGRFGEKKGYFHAIFWAITGSGIAIFLQGFIDNITFFSILQILVGVFTVGINPSLSSAVTLCTKPEVRGRAFGLTTTAQQFGSMFGPLVAGTVTSLWGIQYVFLGTGLFLLFAGKWIHRRHKDDVAPSGHLA